MSTTANPRVKTSTPIAVGDIIPAAELPTQDGTAVSFYADGIAGNYIVLILCDSAGSDLSSGCLKRFADAHASIATAGGVVFAVTTRSPAENTALKTEIGLPFPALADRDRMYFRGLDVAANGPTIVVIRPNLHVMAIIGPEESEQAATVLAIIGEDADNRRPRPGERHPPILMIPDVLSREDCQKLISIYTLQGNVMVEPSHGSQNRTSDYKMRIPDYGRQDRIDHWVINEETTRFISDRLKARVFPEIEKAFQYKITRFERFRIGCYKGERGGEAHGHRDNTAPITAHRRFAVSVNLNSEQFEGGELRFPEYGGQLYSPATGEAIGFSSSILHEPLHVTSGTRFVLLSFLFGEH